MVRARARVLRVLLLSGLTSIGLYGGASCGSDPATASTTTTASSSSSGAGGAGGASAQDVVVYEGDANDEAYAAITAKDGPPNPSTYATFDSPSEGVVLPASPAPTFTWHVHYPDTSPDAGPDSGSDAGAFLLHPGAPSPRRAALSPLLDLFGKERSARAHGTPLSGFGYLLLFNTEKDSDLLRVFTSKTSYTPGPGAMEIFSKVDGVIQVWILSAVFDNDVVTPDGGPFRGPWTSFELMK